MHDDVERRFTAVDSCVDYRSYVYHIDSDLSAEHYENVRRRLLKLGRSDEERMGVVYVRGPWGFFVVPHHGFPSLRVSFFHDTPENECHDVLRSISKVFDETEIDLNRGDF